MSHAGSVAEGSKAKTPRHAPRGHADGFERAGVVEGGLHGFGNHAPGNMHRLSNRQPRGTVPALAAERMVRRRLRSECRAGRFRIRTGGRSSARGYTLIEVIVAFAILALALTLLLGTLSGAARQVRWAEEAGRAALHAQSLLDQVGVGEALLPGHRNGDFEDGRYRWTLDVVPYEDPLLPPSGAKDLSAPRLLQLSLVVQWGEDADDPRSRLQLQSLRLVTPNPLDVAPLP